MTSELPQKSASLQGILHSPSCKTGTPFFLRSVKPPSPVTVQSLSNSGCKSKPRTWRLLVVASLLTRRGVAILGFLLTQRVQKACLSKISCGPHGRITTKLEYGASSSIAPTTGPRYWVCPYYAPTPPAATTRATTLRVRLCTHRIVESIKQLYTRENKRITAGHAFTSKQTGSPSLSGVLLVSGLDLQQSSERYSRLMSHGRRVVRMAVVRLTGQSVLSEGESKSKHDGRHLPHGICPCRTVNVTGVLEGSPWDISSLSFMMERTSNCMLPFRPACTMFQ
eukprot:45129-Prorocentrum_minimum.AAC.2